MGKQNLANAEGVPLAVGVAGSKHCACCGLALMEGDLNETCLLCLYTYDPVLTERKLHERVDKPEWPLYPLTEDPQNTRTKEEDPTGRKPSDPGAKLDQGKIRMGLVLGGFANALREVCKVGTNGAAKYSDNGWKEVPNGEARYMDALHRHLNKHQTGEAIDPEWKLLHLAHAAWNCLSILELELKKKEKEV